MRSYGGKTHKLLAMEDQKWGDLWGIKLFFERTLVISAPMG
jgi:hypothetical protein